MMENESQSQGQDLSLERLLHPAIIHPYAPTWFNHTALLTVLYEVSVRWTGDLPADPASWQIPLGVQLSPSRTKWVWTFTR